MQMLHAFRNFLHQQGIRQYPIHIELDSGMHRLGFVASDMPELCRLLSDMPEVKIRSVFSHLAGSSESEHDAFTKNQIDQFNELSSSIRKAIGYEFLRHIANSGAIHRHPSAQFDMVRLGIGLYGVDPDPSIQPLLQNVSTLRTTISQIKMVRTGESIGYSRKAIASRDMVIAVVRIGYADGYPRVLSNGIGKMLVNNIPAPVVGNICMDMTMLDITGMDAAEGDEVIVFGEFLPVTLLANWAGTIPYEILTGISQRVRRDYFEE
jgi:alanine racemase